MSYTCISADEVKAKFDAAEKTLNECFDMLMDFRYGRNDLGNAILKFQPLLAECLFELMQFYQKLHQEKDELIARKNSYEKAVFADLMKTNAQYAKAVSTAIDIGKNMGDAYAWYFFKDNRKELEKHLEHESTGLFVGGIGGHGELEFIKHSSNIDGLYVLYHGITTMLRIGDFSLFDSEHGIAGVGELKTKLVDDTLQVTATITSRAEIRLPKLPPTSNKSVEERIKETQRDFPRLERQLSTHTDLLHAKESDRSSELYSSYDYDMLNTLTPETPLAVNSDNSLMVVAAWSKYDSLFDVLIENEEATPLPDDFQEKALSLTKPESPYNMVFIGDLVTQISLLSIPILWWKIDEKLCRDIYFKRVKIETIFNPAKLLKYFLEDGFSVSTGDSLKKFEIHKDIDNHRIGVGHFESICYLITNSLMKTKDVYEFSKQVTDAIANGEYQPGSRVDMHIRLNNFGKPKADTTLNADNSRKDENNG